MTLTPAAARVRTPPDPWQTITLGIALLVPALVGLNLDLKHSLTVGMAAGIALAPVWIAPARRMRGTGALGLTVLLCVVTSTLLGQWTSMTHSYHRSGLIDSAIMLVGSAAAVGALLWCRRALPMGVIAMSYAVGALAATVVSPTARAAENSWKFGVGLPIAIGALGLAAVVGRWWCDLLLLAVLAGVGAVSDARSSSALLALAMLLVIWQARPRFPGRVSTAAGGLVFLTVLAYVLYRAAEAAILNGFLGTTTEQRTQAQIDQSGSLILGGRPEIGATWALLGDHPLGYGAGIAPNAHDLLVAKTGMASLGYPPNNGYVERYMFGQGHFELHSLIGDFWAICGLAGLLLCGLIGWVALRYVGTSIATGAGTALGYFLAVRVLWDLPFSPIASTLDHLTLAVALLLLPRVSAGVRRPAGGTPVDLGMDLGGLGPVPSAQVGAAGHLVGRHERGRQIVHPH